MSCHTNDEEKRARDEISNYQRFSHENLISLLYHEVVQHDPTAHVTSTIWLVFPYFKVTKKQSNNFSCEFFFRMVRYKMP